MVFSGKTLLVTGGTSGIGRATVTLLAQRGATVVVNHLGQHRAYRELAADLAGGAGNLMEVEADVSDGAAVSAMVDRLMAYSGRLDGLVNNAGISQIKPFLQTREEDWDRIVDTDLKSVFLCCKAAIPHLLESRGAIVNIASELALSGRATMGPYTAAKGGVISLTRSLAREFAPRIRVNAVAPGPTATPMLAAEARVPGHTESTADIPLGRFAEPDEIAESILFLLSPRASYFCGDIISPNGGAVMR